MRTRTVSLIGFLLAGLLGCRGSTAPRDDRITSVTIVPSSINMAVGDRVPLSAAVTAGPDQPNHRVRWASQNSGVATVDPDGVVSSIGGGTTTITATSLADTMATGTARVTVSSIFGGVTIAAINQDGKPADLNNLAGKVDVIVNVDLPPTTVSRVEIVLNRSGADTVVATVNPSSSATAPITLSFSTAGLRNGPYALKARAILSSQTVVASSATAIAINNPSS